jgi:hypothetical protein
MREHFDEVAGVHWQKLQHLVADSGKAGRALPAVWQSQKSGCVSRLVC